MIRIQRETEMNERVANNQTTATKIKLRKNGEKKRK